MINDHIFFIVVCGTGSNNNSHYDTWADQSYMESVLN